MNFGDAVVRVPGLFAVRLSDLPGFVLGGVDVIGDEGENSEYGCAGKAGSCLRQQGPGSAQAFPLGDDRLGICANEIS
jgi:hypothetical protein